MANFRTCPDTGFKIDLNADKLIKWNAVSAIVFLLIGGLFGLVADVDLRGLIVAD